MLLGGEIAAQGANQTDSQDDDSDGDVQAVEAGQREEGGTKCLVLGVKMLAKEVRVLVDLTSQEDQTQHNCTRQTYDEVSPLSPRNTSASDTYGNATREQDKGIE